VSSIVPKSKREQREQRSKIEDFDANELIVINTIKSAFSVNEVVVLGSRARGNWAEDSDIDIGVKGYSNQKHKKMIATLTERLPIKPDLFRFEAALTHKGAVIV